MNFPLARNFLIIASPPIISRILEFRLPRMPVSHAVCVAWAFKQEEVEEEEEEEKGG